MQKGPSQRSLNLLIQELNSGVQAIQPLCKAVQHPLHSLQPLPGDTDWAVWAFRAATTLVRGRFVAGRGEGGSLALNTLSRGGNCHDQIKSVLFAPELTEFLAPLLDIVCLELPKSCHLL